jgi:hypothetical protein
VLEDETAVDVVVGSVVSVVVHTHLDDAASNSARKWVVMNSAPLGKTRSEGIISVPAPALIWPLAHERVATNAAMTAIERRIVSERK